MNKFLNKFFPTNPEFPPWAEKYPEIYVIASILFLLLILALMAKIFRFSIEALYVLPEIMFFIVGAFYLYKFLYRNK